MSSPPPSRFQRAAPPSAKAPLPTGQVNTAAHSADGRIRLNKRMSELGLASRREADAWIAKGWVKVNGSVATMGMQVTPDVHIEIASHAHGQQAQQVTVLVHKPLGLVSGQAEDGHLPAISLVQARNRWTGDPVRTTWHPAHLKNLVPAGRLDIDSTGLLVLTQDGRVARQLIGQDSEVEKEYLVRVAYTGHVNTAAAHSAAATHAHLSRIDDDDPVTSDVQSVFPAHKLALLRHGLSLDGQALQPAKVSWQNPEQLRIVLTEGKKRQIRRICELVGLKVTGLKRVRIGNIMLGALPLGQWRYLGPHERFY